MPRTPVGEREIERKVVAILRVLDMAEGPLGARLIAQRLHEYGVELSERAVRYHLQLMDGRGLTQGLGEPGRVITDQGRMELREARVGDKVGFVVSRIDALAYRATYDLNNGQGDIILNISLIPKNEFRRSVEIMREVFRAGYSMGELVAVAGESERLGEMLVPAGYQAFGTVCSVTLNGVLLKQGIPVESRFGGLLQIQERSPLRFTELIDYAGTTLDPLEIFIAGKLTSVTEASRTGDGKIGASFREAPALSLGQINGLLAGMREAKLGGVIAIGRPSHPLLDIPVGVDMVGLIVIGGLTPLAAVQEAGVPVINKAMSTLVPYTQLVSIWDL